MQMKSDEARKDLRWWASLLLTTLPPENGLNRMNGFNVSCLPPLPPLLCCLLEVLTVFTKPTNPPGGLCPLFVQCFVQDCPFVPTTGHKNSVSSSDCGREAAVRADFFASPIHLLPHLARLGGRLPLPSTHCWEHSLKIGLLCLLTNWEIGFDGSDLTENVINLFRKPGLAVLHYPFPF